ncbi:site-specific integrase [Paenibacillus lautus]|uniref:tyrosine-type recombinase/integrase n=1 Tax=Paenibacillus lautus TaxID=1401 RepID=UPI001B0778D8|nr:tyrosine-type recombinase/integrase [Paenibacillus lautus]GIP02054.1 site-specific integrase [Paenibacillus lautus]
MSKRKNNDLEEGVRLRNGKYSFRYDIPDPVNGGRIQKETPGYPSMKELKPIMIQIQAELLNETYVETKNTTVSSWIDQWLEIYSSSGLVKQRTIITRRGELNRLKNAIGGMRIKDVDLLRYQNFLNDLKNEGLARRTISGTHTASTMLFEKAVQMGVIKNNPTKYAVIPSYQKTVEELENESEVPKFLEKEELAHFLRTAAKMDCPQGFHGLFTIAYTGMRVGELCALRTTDRDRLNKTISITKTLYDKKGTLKFALNTPKTKSSKRKIDVSETVMKVLDKQDSWRNEFKMSRRNEYYEGPEFMFINEATLPGWPARIQFFDQFMKKVLIEAGLPTNFTPHSLRHTYTSLMAEAGVELESIQRLLGHSNNDITRSVYLHVTQAKKREAVEKLDALMNGLL